MEVLKQTSPVRVPGAPMDMPWNTVPSSRARRAVMVGFSYAEGEAEGQSEIWKKAGDEIGVGGAGRDG